jgi:cysteine synthase
VRTDVGSRIEGIGRQRVEPSWLPTVVDRMVSVPDAASIAAMRWCTQVTGRWVGGSTGTNLWGAFRLVAQMYAEGRRGSVVTLLCDAGDRYAHTYYDDAWLAAHGLHVTPYLKTLQEFAATGTWHEPG